MIDEILLHVLISPSVRGLCSFAQCADVMLGGTKSTFKFKKLLVEDDEANVALGGHTKAECKCELLYTFGVCW